MAYLNLRFDLDIDDENFETDSINQLLPPDFISDIRRKENCSLSNQNKITGLSYCYSYEDLFELDLAINSFIARWKEYSSVLKELNVFGFDFHITFEVTVTDWNFPAIVFEKEFIDFTSEHNISFGMYFWSGDAKYNEE
jgi:hypothetical protein